MLGFLKNIIVTFFKTYIARYYTIQHIKLYSNDVINATRTFSCFYNREERNIRIKKIAVNIATQEGYKHHCDIIEIIALLCHTYDVNFVNIKNAEKVKRKITNMLQMHNIKDKDIYIILQILDMISKHYKIQDLNCFDAHWLKIAHIIIDAVQLSHIGILQLFQCVNNTHMYINMSKIHIRRVILKSWDTDFNLYTYTGKKIQQKLIMNVRRQLHSNYF